MFTEQEKNIIDQCHNRDFEFIHSENADGSINIDVFDLYKIADGSYKVLENGNSRWKGTLQNCLDYIHRWL